MADLRDQARDVLHLLDNVIHRAPRSMNLIGPRLHLAGAGVDQLANIIGSIGAAARQMTYFTRHDGKTFPLLPRACRFNRRIQRQNVSLESDIVNQFCN
ncbi:hypothetical protein D3C78_1029280 [compost metagenome]